MSHLDTPQFALHARNLFVQLDSLTSFPSSTTSGPVTAPTATQTLSEVTTASEGDANEDDVAKKPQVRQLSPVTSEVPPTTVVPVFTQTTIGAEFVTDSSLNEVNENGSEGNTVVSPFESLTSQSQRPRSPRKVVLSSVTYPPLTKQTTTESSFITTTKSSRVDNSNQESVRRVKSISQFSNFPTVANSQADDQSSVRVRTLPSSDDSSPSPNLQPVTVSKLINRSGRILLVNAEDSDTSFNDLTIRYQLPAAVSPSAKITPVLKVTQGEARQPRRFFN